MINLSSNQLSVGIKTYGFSFDSKSGESDRLFHNEKLTLGTSKRPGRTITWLRDRTRNNSETGFSTNFTPRRTSTPRKKHFIPSPFGIILKGKKLKQRYCIGSIFRENLETNEKFTMFRNEQNMRSKWK